MRRQPVTQQKDGRKADEAMRLPWVVCVQGQPARTTATKIVVVGLFHLQFLELSGLEFSGVNWLKAGRIEDLVFSIRAGTTPTGGIFQVMESIRAWDPSSRVKDFRITGSRNRS